MDNIWDTKFLELADLYKTQFLRSDTEEFLKWMANTPIIVGVLCQSYGVMVKLEMIPRIETISSDEKWELFNEAKRLSESQEKEYLVSLSKSIYALGQYIQV